MLVEWTLPLCELLPPFVVPLTSTRALTTTHETFASFCAQTEIYPVLDKISGPKGAESLSSTGLGLDNLIERERERESAILPSTRTENQPFICACIVLRAKTKGQFLPGVVFAKGREFLLVSLGEGFGVGFRGVVGGGFPVKNKGKGAGSGEGGWWGRDRQRNQQVNAQVWSKLPFIRNARLFIILFVRNFWRVCSQFWLSVRNSV